MFGILRSDRGLAKLPLIIVLAVVLIGGGAFVGLKVLGGKGAKAAPKEVPLTSSVHPLGTFVINLNPTDGFKYLKVTVALVVKSPLPDDKIKAETAKEKYRWSDVLVKSLSGRTYSEIRTDEGRLKLEQQLIRLLNGETEKGEPARKGAAAGKGGRAEDRDEHAGEKSGHPKIKVKVDTIYFSEFVAQ
ncbi:MAG: flagellar basal body-associated FliL family protein [Armatimonadetes bacterium]|nr:flagellar basal body-associated FliL family protein [Armatimonadota bacterium]